MEALGNFLPGLRALSSIIMLGIAIGTGQLVAISRLPCPVPVSNGSNSCGEVLLHDNFTHLFISPPCDSFNRTHYSPDAETILDSFARYKNNGPTSDKYESGRRHLLQLLSFDHWYTARREHRLTSQAAWLKSTSAIINATPTTTLNDISCLVHAASALATDMSFSHTLVLSEIALVNQYRYLDNRFEKYHHVPGNIFYDIYTAYSEMRHVCYNSPFEKERLEGLHATCHLIITMIERARRTLNIAPRALYSEMKGFQAIEAGELEELAGQVNAVGMGLGLGQSLTWRFSCKTRISKMEAAGRLQMQLGSFIGVWEEIIRDHKTEYETE